MGSDGQKEIECRREKKTLEEDDRKEITKGVRLLKRKHAFIANCEGEILGVLQAAGCNLQTTALQRLKRKAEELEANKSCKAPNSRYSTLDRLAM